MFVSIEVILFVKKIGKLGHGMTTKTLMYFYVKTICVDLM